MRFVNEIIIDILTLLGQFPLQMKLKMLKAKIHRAYVTDANLEYEGSVTIDSSLMEEAGIREYEHVCIWDITNGARVETYAIKGEPNSGAICINGSAAHHVSTGNKVIISAFAYFDESEVKAHAPKIVLVDEKNRIASVKRG